MGMIGSFRQVTPDELRKLIADPTAIDELLYPEDDGGDSENSIDVDKAWHAIHFLLTGDATGGSAPLCNVIMGGAEIGEDMGYGPASYLTASEVKAAAEALRALPGEQLAKRFDAEALEKNDIYPNIWDEGPDALDYILPWYGTLREYYLDAAAKGNAMLKWLS